MTRAETIRETLEQWNPDAMLADGFDAALIGIAEQYGKEPLALYDRRRCIEILMQQGMTEEGAEEFFEFNTLGAYVGEGTPVFATIIAVPEPAAV